MSAAALLTAWRERSAFRQTMPARSRAENRRRSFELEKTVYLAEHAVADIAAAKPRFFRCVKCRRLHPVTVLVCDPSQAFWMFELDVIVGVHCWIEVER